MKQGTRLKLRRNIEKRFRNRIRKIGRETKKTEKKLENKRNKHGYIPPPAVLLQACMH